MGEAGLYLYAYVFLTDLSSWGVCHLIFCFSFFCSVYFFQIGRWGVGGRGEVILFVALLFRLFAIFVVDISVK